MNKDGTTPTLDTTAQITAPPVMRLSHVHLDRSWLKGGENDYLGHESFADHVGWLEDLYRRRPSGIVSVTITFEDPIR